MTSSARGDTTDRRRLQEAASPRPLDDLAVSARGEGPGVEFVRQDEHPHPGRAGHAPRAAARDELPAEGLDAERRAGRWTPPPDLRTVGVEQSSTMAAVTRAPALNGSLVALYPDMTQASAATPDQQPDRAPGRLHRARRDQQRLLDGRQADDAVRTGAVEGQTGRPAPERRRPAGSVPSGRGTAPCAGDLLRDGAGFGRCGRPRAGSC